MIKVTDINKLPNNEKSLNQLQEFLSTTLSHQTYQMAFYKYVYICNQLNLDSLVLELTQKRLNDIKLLEPTKYDEKIIYVLIDSSLKLQAFDVARYYIDYRKNYLTVMESYLSLFDEINYAKALNLPYIEYLLKLENENLDNRDQKIYVLDEILNYYVNQKEHEVSLKYIEKLKQLDLESKYKELEYFLLLKVNNFNIVKSEVLSELKENNSKPIHIAYLITALYNLNDLKLASDLEAAHENDFDLLTLNQKVDLFEVIIKIYESLNHKASIDVYKKKLNKVKRELTKVTTSEELKKDKPLINQEKEVIYLKQLDENETKQTNNVYYEILNNLYIYAFSLQNKMSLREKLRLLFIRLQQHLNFYEVIIYDNTINPNLYHFKKERLYDKYIIDNLIYKTLVEEIIKGKNDYIHTNNLTEIINIITQKPYDELINTAYSFSVSFSSAIIFHFEEKIIDPGAYYDLLRGVRTLIEILFNLEKQNERLVNQSFRFDELFSSSNIPMRIMNSFQSHYNQYAQDLLDVETRLPYDMFILNVSNKDIHNYKHQVAYLLQSEDRYNVIDYEYNNLFIKEYLYSRKFNDQIEVVSFFINLTPINDSLKNLNYIAHVDINTKVNNINSFINDLPNFLENKVTFVLVELNTELKSIYGSQKMNEHFYEFVDVCVNYLDDVKIYIYENNQIMLVFPFNDIRRTTKEVKTFHNYIENYLPQTIKDLNFEIYSGILRYPVVTEEKNINKLRKYFDISLDKAKNNKEYNYEFFAFSDYEKDVFEDQLILQLNEAINNFMFTLHFKQLINITNNKVWQYEVSLSLDNLLVDIKYLYTIAKKRKRLKHLEFHLIEMVCKFLNKLSFETGSLVKLTIPISKETFLDRKFNAYLLQTLKNYEIPNSFIRIKTDAVLRNTRYLLKIEELISAGISLDSVDLEMNLRFGFHALHIDYDLRIKNINVYLSSLLELTKSLNIVIIVRNVNTITLREELRALGIVYIEGSIYKDVSMENLVLKIKEASK